MNGNDEHHDERDDFDARLMRKARELGTEVQPERDLWPGIAAAIAAPGRGSGRYRPRLVAQAAAVLLLAGGSSAVTWLVMQDEAAPVTVAGQPASLDFEPVSGSFGSEYSLGPDFTDARNMLVSKLDAELERLPPETRAEVVENIATIRRAIADINRALADEPDNVLLQDLLMSAYSEELKVMRKVDRLANSVMRREDI